MSELSKTNIDDTKHLRFELDAAMFKDWLSSRSFQDKSPYALYFEMKRPSDDGEITLDHIEVVPVYLTNTGNVRKPNQALTLASSTTGVSLVSFPEGSVVTSIPEENQPDYRALEQFVDRVGFVMFSFETVKFMIDNSDHVFISSLLFDPRSFQFSENGEIDVNYPIYTLKIEIEPLTPDTPPSSNPMNNLYPPFLVGTPCAKVWYNKPS